MKHLLPAGVLAIASAACAAGPAAQPVPKAEAVAIEWSAWPGGADAWTVNSLGQVTHKTVDVAYPAPVKTTTVTKAFTISSRDFDTLLVILAPARDKLGAGVTCDKPLMTDQPFLTIKWSLRGSDYTLGVSYGCVSPAMASVQESYQKATVFLRSLEAAAPS